MKELVKKRVTSSTQSKSCSRKMNQRKEKVTTQVVVKKCSNKELHKKIVENISVKVTKQCKISTKNETVIKPIKNEKKLALSKPNSNTNTKKSVKNVAKIGSININNLMINIRK